MYCKNSKAKSYFTTMKTRANTALQYPIFRPCTRILFGPIAHLRIFRKSHKRMFFVVGWDYSPICGGTADEVELFPKVGEGFADLLGLFYDHVGENEREHAECHRYAVVGVGADGGAGFQPSSGKAYLGGGLRDGGTHLLQLFLEGADAVGLFDAQIFDASQTGFHAQCGTADQHGGQQVGTVDEIVLERVGVLACAHDGYGAGVGSIGRA